MSMYKITDAVALAGGFNVDGLSLKHKKIPVSTLASSSEKDGGWDLPADAVVLDVFVNVKTAEATGTTKTLDVGLLSSESGGDADGFLDGVTVATTGIKRGVATVTVGGTETYFASTTRGALFGTFLAGANVAGDVGTLYERPHIAGSVTAKSVSYTAGSNDFAELVADIHVLYLEVE